MEAAGTRLKKIRLEKGLTLEEVQKKTKVHVNILKAIEGDSISNLNPIYLKGFIKIYCGFLGVDYREYMVEEKEAPAPVAQAPVSLKTGHPSVQHAHKEPLAAASPILKNPQVQLGSNASGRRLKKIIIGIAGILCLLLLAFGINKFIFSKRKISVSAKPKAALKQAPKKEVKKAREVKNIPVAVSNAQPIPIKIKKEALLSGIRLGLRTRESTWVMLKVDGRVVVQRKLEKGRGENYDGKDKIELSVGNGGAIELEVNGQVFSKLGRWGEPIKAVITKEEGLIIIPR